MPKRIKNTIFILLIITVFLIVILFISSNPDSKLHSLYKAVSAPFQLIQRGFTSVGKGISQRLAVLSDYSDIRDRLNELQSENDRLSVQQEEYERLQQENEELRALLDLKAYFTDYHMVAANIIAQDVTDWFNELTIDRGTADGLYDGSVVITSKGLVGIVYNAGPFSSKVRTVADEQNTVMGRIARNNELVRVRGMSYENYVRQLKLDRITAGTDLYVGDVIITAESGGVYPKGLVIGTVVEVNLSSGSERSAVIEPAVNLGRISEVYVLVSRDGKAEGE